MLHYGVDSAANSGSHSDAAVSAKAAPGLDDALRNEALQEAYGTPIPQGGSSILSQRPDLQVPLICHQYAGNHSDDALSGGLVCGGVVTGAISGADFAFQCMGGSSLLFEGIESAALRPMLSLGIFVAAAAAAAYGVIRRGHVASKNYSEIYNRCLNSFK